MDFHLCNIHIMSINVMLVGAGTICTTSKKFENRKYSFYLIIVLYFYSEKLFVGSHIIDLIYYIYKL